MNRALDKTKSAITDQDGSATIALGLDQTIERWSITDNMTAGS